MKLLLASMLAGALGLGWIGDGTDAALTRAAPAAACNVRTEPIGNGKVRIECNGHDGSAWAIVACDGKQDCRVLERGGDCARCPWTPACGECPFSSLLCAPTAVALAATSEIAPSCTPTPVVLAATSELIPSCSQAPACESGARCEPAGCDANPR